MANHEYDFNTTIFSYLGKVMQTQSATHTIEDNNTDNNTDNDTNTQPFSEESVLFVSTLDKEKFNLPVYRQSRSYNDIFELKKTGHRHVGVQTCENTMNDLEQSIIVVSNEENKENIINNLTESTIESTTSDDSASDKQILDNDANLLINNLIPRLNATDSPLRDNILRKHSLQLNKKKKKSIKLAKPINNSIQTSTILFSIVSFVSVITIGCIIARRRFYV